VHTIMADRTNVFFVNGRQAVLKTYGTERKWTKESVGLQLLSDSGLPVPSIIAKDYSPAADWWVLMTCLPGRPLHDTDVAEAPADVYRTLGALVARLHSGPTFPAFGAWPTEAPGFPTLPDRVIPRARRDVKKALAMDRPEAERDLLLEAARLLRASETAVLEAYRLRARFLHRDLNSRNVLVTDDWQVAGLVDFERSEPGDPAEDFARLALPDRAWRPDRSVDRLRQKPVLTWNGFQDGPAVR
jgi:aminoglycoside phosphotransferase (APT) family kinase protein